MIDLPVCDKCDYQTQMINRMGCDFRRLCKDALELLKEQEAVAPIRKKLKFSETWECGNCHEELFEGDVIRDNYCWNCGRKVNWG